MCTACLVDYYLLGDGCKVRNNIEISNCLELDLYSDSCLKCEDGTLPNINNNKCLFEISHCKNYENFNNDLEELSCNKCEDFYYLDAEKQC